MTAAIPTSWIKHVDHAPWEERDFHWGPFSINKLMFKLYPSIGKNAAVGAGTWSVNGGKERTLDIKRMFLKIVEKMLDDDVLLSKIQGLLKTVFCLHSSAAQDSRYRKV